MKKLWRLLKWLLIAWGVVCLVGAAVLGGCIAYHVGPGNRDTTNSADRQDVRFVLNGCRLGDERIEEVVHSYQSARSLMGDHLDAYAIRISHVDPAELTQDGFGSGWFRCDEVEGVLHDAIDFVVGWLHEDAISWFPGEAELRSNELYVYPETIYCHGTRPAAVELIFVRPKDKMVFFISTKT